MTSAFDTNDTPHPHTADDGPPSSRARAKAEAKAAAKAEKQSARDQREAERQKLREAKRELRDSRYEIEHFPIAGGAAGVEFWQNFLALHAEHGKEGNIELYWGLMVKWDQFQLGRGGFPCPSELRPAGSPRPSVNHQRVADVLNRAARHPLTVKAEAVLQAAQLS